MNRCPRCGCEFPDKGRAKGGSRRWSGVSKAKRNEIMRKVRAAGVKKAK